MTKRIISVGLAVLAALLSLVVLWQLRIVVIYVLISLMFSSALRPLVKRFSGQSTIRRFMLVLLYLSASAGFVILIYFSGKSAISQLQLLVRNLTELDSWNVPVWLDQSMFNQVLVARLPPPRIFLEAVTGDEGQHVLAVLFGLSQGVGRFVTGVLIILFMSIYWSINQIHFERLWLSLLPSGVRKQTRGIWRIIEPEMGLYIRTQVVISMMTGVILWPAYWALGSPYASLIAIIVAVSSFIPVVGIPFSVLTALIIGMLASVQHGLAIAFLTLITLIGLSVWVRPKFYDRRWENPILTVLLLIALADLVGLIGIILAPPLSVVIQIVWTRLVTRRVEMSGDLHPADLKQRISQLKEEVGRMDGLPLPLIKDSLQRLEVLIDHTDPILSGAPISNNSHTLDGS